MSTEDSSHFVNLSSERITLRRMRLVDINAFYRYRADPEVARFQSWDSYTFEDATNFIHEQCDRLPNIPGQWIQIAIASKDTDALLGDCAFASDLDEPRVVHLGITMSPDSQRQGIAHEALSCLLQYIFVTLNKHRVVATVDARNTASIALFRKLGFRQEGHFMENVFFKGEWGDEIQFAMLEREWKQKHQQV
eukprot:gene38424-46700_t